MPRVNLFSIQNRRQVFILMAAGLAGCVHKVNTKKHFKKFSELKDLARGFIEAPLGGLRLSLPVPIRREGQLQIAFMLCSTITMPGPVRMWPPSKIGWLDPVSGKQIAFTPVSPADFGLTDSADEQLSEWSFRLPPNMAGEGFDNLRKRLFELYDILFSAWAANPSPAGQGRLQNQARDFLRIFDQVSEPPLRPYYDVLGREWFGWVRALAQ